jgi:hypothetical protein
MSILADSEVFSTLTPEQREVVSNILMPPSNGAPLSSITHSSGQSAQQLFDEYSLEDPRFIEDLVQTGSLEAAETIWRRVSGVDQALQHIDREYNKLVISNPNLSLGTIQTAAAAEKANLIANAPGFNSLQVAKRRLTEQHTVATGVFNSMDLQSQSMVQRFMLEEKLSFWQAVVETVRRTPPEVKSAQLKETPGVLDGTKGSGSSVLSHLEDGLQDSMPKNSSAAIPPAYKSNDTFSSIPKFSFEEKSTISDEQKCPSQLQQLQNDVARGFDILTAMGGGALAAAGEIIGSRGAVEAGLDIYQSNMEEVKQNPALIGSFTNIKSVDDGFRYLIEAFGENALMMVPFVLPTGSGGIGEKVTHSEIMQTKPLAQVLIKSESHDSFLQDGVDDVVATLSMGLLLGGILFNRIRKSIR